MQFGYAICDDEGLILREVVYYIEGFICRRVTAMSFLMKIHVCTHLWSLCNALYQCSAYVAVYNHSGLRFLFLLFLAY